MQPEIPSWTVKEPLTLKPFSQIQNSIYKFLNKDYNIDDLILDMVEGHITAQYSSKAKGYVLTNNSMNQIRLEVDNHEHVWKQLREGMQIKEGIRENQPFKGTEPQHLGESFSPFVESPRRGASLPQTTISAINQKRYERIKNLIQS